MSRRGRDRSEARERAPLDFGGNVVKANVLGLLRGAVEEFDAAFGDLLADGDAEGDAYQVCVLELDARALVAVVEEDFEARAPQLFVEPLARVLDLVLLDVRD